MDDIVALSGASPRAAVVLTERRGLLGLITLNRPAVMNALSREMVGLMQRQLDDWRDDDRVATIAIVGAGERGLCAGGDVVSLYRAALAHDTAAAADFLFDEYHLDVAIARYRKPIVTLQDGVVLGGGIGISAHASHRVVTERSRLGLPEVTIGVVPDVGSTWLLSRAPGELGVFLTLTAGTVGAADAITIGLSDTFVSSADLARLLALLETTSADEAIDSLAQDPGPSPLLAQRAWIDIAFAADTVEEVREQLRSLDTAEAAEAIATISRKSPTALAVTLEALRRAAKLDSLEAALDQEYRFARRAFAWPDYVEGVRAQLIDKDRQPRWIDAREVTQAVVDSFFAPLEDRELGLVPPGG